MAEGRGWIYCAGCGNPCRAPAGVRQYACPRCGRHLAARGRFFGGAGRAAGRLGAAWRAVLLLVLVAFGVTIAVYGTLGRVARAEGKSVLVEGLSEDAFAIDGDAVYTRTFRWLYRQSRSGRAKLPLVHARGGMRYALLADGWVYFVTRPWGTFEPIYEIRRVPARGGAEERVARLENLAFFPPVPAVRHGRLYALANWRAPDETWEARILRWEPGGRREVLLLARGLLRPAGEYVVDERDPDRVFWLRPDELHRDGERPGALCEASFRQRRVRRIVEVPHPYGLMQEGDVLCWMNDLYLRPRFSGPGQAPQIRGSAPRTISPADEVQIQVLDRGSGGGDRGGRPIASPPGPAARARIGRDLPRRLTTYTLPHLPAMPPRGTVHAGHYYWLAAEDAVDAREVRLALYRLSLADGQVSVASHFRGNTQGLTAWFLTDPSGGLHLYERYLVENWFDWSPEGLGHRSLGRIWRLEMK